jgi:glycosyltransferase 2 family protein
MQGGLRRRVSVGKIVALVVKLAVTAACFWYVGRQIDVPAFAKTFPAIDATWIGVAVLAVMLQIQLIGLRWFAILEALPGARVPRSRAIAMTWISVFVGQLLPYGAGDAVRAWLVSRLGRNWRIGLISVFIDRGVGVATLFAYGFLALLLPSALAALEGYRDGILFAFAALLVGTVAGLVAVPWVTPVLSRWRYLRWVAIVGSACHDVLVSRFGIFIVVLAFIVHTLSILCIWCVGGSFGVPLSLFDAAVLFVLILGVALIPISIGGWGLREAAVVTLLGNHGMAPEVSLSLSVTFGLVVIVGSLPGAVIWAFYAPNQSVVAKES